MIYSSLATGKVAGCHYHCTIQFCAIIIIILYLYGIKLHSTMRIVPTFLLPLAMPGFDVLIFTDRISPGVGGRDMGEYGFLPSP